MRNARPTLLRPRAQTMQTQAAHTPIRHPPVAAEPTFLFAKGDAATRHLGTQRSATHILVADDNAAMRGIVLTILRVAGFKAHGVDNGAEAVKAVRQGDCDLVLMDIEMPAMDGLDASRAIRALSNAKRQLPIIAFSGNSTPADQENFYQAGMNDFAAKPIAAHELIALIERWTNGGEAIMEKKQNDPPLLESGMLADLEAVVGLESTIDLLILFDETAGTHADAMRRAVKNRDTDTLSKNAHDLKGIAGNCGFSRLSRHAAAIEVACKDRAFPRAITLARQVDKILAESRVFLKATYPGVRTRHKAFA